jgi:hypothetical protein
MLKKFNFTKRKDKGTTLGKELSTSEKFDILLSEIRTIKTDLSDFREEFNNFKKQTSDFQEAHINNKIISVLNYNRSTYTTTLLPIKNIYTPYSKTPLSDFDGLILYTPVQTNMPTISTELLERTNGFHQTLKENISQINSRFAKSYLIIVESKRSLNKHKIDMKLKQLYNFINILSSLNTLKLETTTKQFQEMIFNLQKHSNLSIQDLTQIEVIFILGSDDIPLTLKNYILNIEDAITKETYNTITAKLFKEDTFKDKFISQMIESKNTTKLVKSKLKQYKTLEEFKSIITTYLSDYNMEYITDYLTPYEELENIFTTFKGKIGFTQFNNVTLPHVLQFTVKN